MKTYLILLSLNYIYFTNEKIEVQKDLGIF